MTGKVELIWGSNYLVGHQFFNRGQRDPRLLPMIDRHHAARPPPPG
ncbi:primosome assembly protein PriA, partial [Cutibacterium acnes]